MAARSVARRWIAVRSIPWSIEPEQWQSVLNRWRFEFHKWDTYACGGLKLLPESLVVSSEEHRQLVTMSERLAALLRQVEQRVRRQPSVLKQLGIPRRVARLIAAEPDSHLQLARYDFFPTPTGGWAISEFNEDVPGGFNEIVAAAELLAPFHPPQLRFVDQFRQRLLEAIPETGLVGLLYATGYSEDLQHMLSIEQTLGSRGQRCLLSSPAHIRWRSGQAHVDGQPLAAAIRFYPAEWFSALPNLWSWRRAVRGLPLLNPLTRLVSQSKAIFEICQMPGVLPSEDQKWLASLAPRTHQWHPETADLLLADPQRWVIKPKFGRMGEQVMIGRLVDFQTWQAAVRAASKAPKDYVWQDCFETIPVDFASGPLHPAVGTFLINGHFAGYYSRVAKLPFHTHQAFYVPTVVEDICQTA
jgi:hypothetical protein